MKTLHALAAFAALTVAGCHAFAASPSARQSIEPLVAKIFAAANAHDTGAYMAYFEHSPSLIFAFNGRIIRGWDALYAQQLTWWKDGKSDVVYTQSIAPEYEVLGSGTELVTQQISAHRTGADGKPSTGSAVLSSIWKRLPVGWRIVYCHESWITPPS
ncbi:MAG: YybH family protein [Rudaea sp.]